MLKLAASLLLLVPQAQADDCYSRNRLFSYRDLIHNVAVVDEAGRMTEEEYATAKNLPASVIQNRFAATGKLKCPGSELSAQLTGSNDVITTAAHGMFNLKNCLKTTNIEACTFTVKIGSKEQTSRISNLVGTGLDCKAFKPMTKDDWAVLKLDPPISGVKPYELPGRDVVKEGDDVISVTAMARDFLRTDATGRRFMPKTIEECQVKQTQGVTRVASFDSNCDLARGSSGGSILKTSRDGDVLMGISVSNNETEQMLQQAERRGTPNTGNYRPDSWGSYHVPLNANFLKAVESATGGRAI